MSKMSRKIAAMIAAAMTATTIGAMNAFADYSDLSLNDGDGGTKTGSASLNIRKVSGEDLVYNSTKVWDIDIEGNELTWEVKHNLGAQNLTWNSETGSYSLSTLEHEGFDFNETRDNSNSNYANDGDADEANDFDKSVTLKNKCNFSVTYTASAVNDVTPDTNFLNNPEYSSRINLFNVQSGDSGDMVTYGATADVTIRPDILAIEAYVNNAGRTDFLALAANNTSSKMQLGHTSFVFTGDDTLFEYNYNNVNITG